jgi:hypothetical protein
METTGQANGNAFAWRATILVALMMSQMGKIVEAVMTLEEVKQK